MLLNAWRKDIVWIVGGIDKGNDYSELFEVVREKVKAIVCLGKDNKKIIELLRIKFPLLSKQPLWMKP